MSVWRQIAMNKSKSSFIKYLVGAAALLLATCAASFSIAGLAKLFAGAATSVILMASVLEFSKLILASFLYQYWNVVNKAIRVYLTTSIVVLATITSIGIYGFLSASYQNTKLRYDLTQSIVDSLSTKQQWYQTTVDNLNSQLQQKMTLSQNLLSIRNSQELQSSRLIQNNRSNNSVNVSSRRTDVTIKQTNSEISELNSKILSYTDSLLKIRAVIKQSTIKNELSSELGSLTFLSKVFQITMDQIVNVLILLFILVFDPLAICMVIVFNFLQQNSKTSTKSDFHKKGPRTQSEYINRDIEYNSDDIDSVRANIVEQTAELNPREEEKNPPNPREMYKHSVSV